MVIFHSFSGMFTRPGTFQWDHHRGSSPSRLRWAASVVASRAFDSSLKGVILAPFADVPWPTGGFSGWADWPWLTLGMEEFWWVKPLDKSPELETFFHGLGKKIWYFLIFLLGWPIAAHWIGMNGAFLSSHWFHLQVWDRSQGGPDSLRYVFVSTCWETKWKTLYSIHCLIILIIISPRNIYWNCGGDSPFSDTKALNHSGVPHTRMRDCAWANWNCSCQLPGGSVAQGRSRAEPVFFFVVLQRNFFHTYVALFL